MRRGDGVRPSAHLGAPCYGAQGTWLRAVPLCWLVAGAGVQEQVWVPATCPAADGGLLWFCPVRHTLGLNEGCSPGGMNTCVILLLCRGDFPEMTQKKHISISALAHKP